MSVACVRVCAWACLCTLIAPNDPLRSLGMYTYYKLRFSALEYGFHSYHRNLSHLS